MSETQDLQALSAPSSCWHPVILPDPEWALQWCPLCGQVWFDAVPTEER